MAAPLFVPSEAELKAKLRLSAVPASATDTEAIFDEAMLRARIRLYRALGTSRVNELLLTAYTESPTTDQQVLRALASTVEVKMVYCALLRMLPNTFMDAAGDVNKRWNEEAPVRERGSLEIAEELQRCEDEITSDLQILCENDLSDACDVQTYDGTPDCPAPRVGWSLKSRSVNPLYGNDPVI